MAPTPRRDKSTGRKPKKTDSPRAVAPSPAPGSPKPVRVQSKPVAPAAPSVVVVVLRTVLAVCIVVASLCGAIAIDPVAVEKSGLVPAPIVQLCLTALFELSTLRSAAAGTAPQLSPHAGAEAAATAHVAYAADATSGLAAAAAAYSAVLGELHWRGAGRVVLSDADLDAREMSCEVVGSPASLEPSLAGALAATPAAAAVFVTVERQAGELLALAARRTGKQELEVGVVDAWLRSATVAAAAAGSSASSSSPALVDATVAAAAAFSQAGLSTLAVRMYETALHQATQRAAWRRTLRSVSGALLEVMGVAPGQATVTRFSAEELARAGAEEGGQDDLEALRVAAQVALRSTAATPPALCVSVLAVKGGRLALARRLASAVGNVSASTAAAQLSALMGSTFTGSAVKCGTPTVWSSECGKVLIAANRAAEAAVSAFSKDGGSACTCTSEEEASTVHVCAEAGAQGAPSTAAQGSLAQAARMVVEGTQAVGVDSVASSVLGPGSRHSGCGTVDGYSTQALPTRLAGWLDCDAPSSTTQGHCAAGVEPARLLGLGPQPGADGLRHALPRSFFLAARAHVLTLLALSGGQPAADEAASRVTRQALQASVAPLLRLLEVCGCD
jgi:hypothetical protein